MRRIAAKLLTPSDLTLFKPQFHSLESGGNQKAINLSKSPFITELYPLLPELAEAKGGKIPIDLSIFGPGLAGLHNVQRKIVKHRSYKNWRLNGEFIDDPPGETGRYAALQPGDLALFEFFDVSEPSSATILLIARDLDPELHSAVAAFIKQGSMISVTTTQLEELASSLPLERQHPFHEFLMESDLEDAAEDGDRGVRRLLSRKGRKVDRTQLRRARQRADEIGRLGEELLNGHFAAMQQSGRLRSYAWDSDENAVSPFDFTIEEEGGLRYVLDAKATAGTFERVMHVSYAELRAMGQEDRRYDIYRLFNVTQGGASFRICQDMGEFARELLGQLELPVGVTVDSVSIDPTQLPFGLEQFIEVTETDDEPQ